MTIAIVAKVPETQTHSNAIDIDLMCEDIFADEFVAVERISIAVISVSIALVTVSLLSIFGHVGMSRV